MKLNKTAKKVLAWRILSFTISFLVSIPVLGSYTKSLGFSICLHIILTAAHYFFEKFWERNQHET